MGIILHSLSVAVMRSNMSCFLERLHLVRKGGWEENCGLVCGEGHQVRQVGPGWLSLYLCQTNLDLYETLRLKGEIHSFLLTHFRVYNHDLTHHTEGF